LKSEQSESFNDQKGRDSKVVFQMFVRHMKASFQPQRLALSSGAPSLLTWLLHFLAGLDLNL
jgi:hypothetical protein